MTQLKTLLFSLFLSCVHTTIFAQIQKGNYNFGGDVGLSANSTSSNTLNGKDARLLVSPSVGKFLTNEWLVSVKPILSTQNQTYKLSDFGSNLTNDYTLGQTNVGVGIGSRYYLSLSDKTSFFGAVNASFAHQWSNVSFANQGGNYDNKIEGNVVTYGGGVGLNVAVKQGVFFETSLSYNATESKSGTGTRKFDFFSLNCGLNHFIGNPKKADIEADYAFIKQGRQMFSGGLTINKMSDVYSTIINPKFSQFVTDNVLVSGEASISNVSSAAGVDNQIITLTASSRYYFPVKNRFFLYPELSYTRRYENTSANSSSSYSKNELAIGIGGNYFLSKNVALEATFLQARFNIFAEQNNEQRTLTGLVGLGNVGLVYFIR